MVIRMQQYRVTGMSCAACSSRVEKAVGKVEGVTSCSVSFLTNSMVVEGEVKQDEIIRAVEKAGYSASVEGENETGTPVAQREEQAQDKAFSRLKYRLWFSVGFLLILMYFSMGHMMWGWPLPSVMENNHVAMGILQMLLTIIIHS